MITMAKQAFADDLKFISIKCKIILSSIIRKSIFVEYNCSVAI